MTSPPSDGKMANEAFWGNILTKQSKRKRIGNQQTHFALAEEQKNGS